MQFVFQKIGTLAILFLLSAVVISAQPGNDLEREKEVFLYKTIKEIKKLNTKIHSFPKNADFYNKRGVLYLELFLKFGATVEYKNVIYETKVDKKSIKDLNVAVNLSHKAEHFLNRGRFYEKCWLDETGDLGYDQLINSANQDNPPVSWQIIEEKFFKNTYFANAESDYIEAIKRAAFHKPKNNYDFSPKTLYGDNYLMPLYYKRASALMYNSVLSKRIILENKAIIVLKDWDKQINYFKERVGTENEMINDSVYLKVGYELKEIAKSRLRKL